MRGFLWKVATNTLLAIVIGAAPTQAQLATQHIKGTTGLKAGSQPPPHVYVIGPLVYVYSTDEVKDPDGNTLFRSADAALTSVAAAGGVSVGHHEEAAGRLLRILGAVPSLRQQPDPRH
jgi:hypothetical protein